MTWRFKVQGVVLVVVVLAVLALAAGASWVEGDLFDGFVALF
jgi:hypothetical protein